MAVSAELSKTLPSSLPTVSTINLEICNVCEAFKWSPLVGITPSALNFSCHPQYKLATIHSNPHMLRPELQHSANNFSLSLSLSVSLSLSIQNITISFSEKNCGKSSCKVKWLTAYISKFEGIFTGKMKIRMECIFPKWCLLFQSRISSGKSYNLYYGSRMINSLLWEKVSHNFSS